MHTATDGAPRARRASERSGAAPVRAGQQRDWGNILFVLAAHALAVLGALYVGSGSCSWWSVALGGIWFALCGFAITGGYHRLFAHPTYRAHPLLTAFHLLFGAASAQNSALKWSADHRLHHKRTDTDDDPYNIRRGFWWAHIGWVFFKDPDVAMPAVSDLRADRLIVLQDRLYAPLAAAVGAVLPAALGLLWDDPLGAFLAAGPLRLVVQWHATFAVNSFAHTVGSHGFSPQSSAGDSFWVALITLGEGYHNFHHRFPLDYRNGVRWYHVDPTKWLLWSLSWTGLVRDLRRTPRERVARARASAP